MKFLINTSSPNIHLKRTTHIHMHMGFYVVMSLAKGRRDFVSFYIEVAGITSQGDFALIYIQRDFI